MNNFKENLKVIFVIFRIIKLVFKSITLRPFNQKDIYNQCLNYHKNISLLIFLTMEDH